MTENLYEMNHLTNDSNGAFLQNSLTRIANPQNELSPVLDIQHGGGSWDCNQLEKSTSSVLTETMDSHVVYPLNAAVTSNYTSSSNQQTLDSFSKVFPVKSTGVGYRVGEKGSEDNHASQILLSPQSGAPSDVSDREPFSPVTMRSQSQQFQNPYMHHAMDGQNTTLNFYQNHQQYHQYPQSQPAYKVPFYKSQGQYLIQQQGLQIYQHQLTSYSLALQKQQSQVDAHEGQESVGSPTYSYTEAPVQASFQQATKGLPLHSPHFQGPEQFCSISLQHDPYPHQYQQLNEQSHSFSFKQDQIASVDDVHDFSSPQEDVCVDLIYPNKRDDFFNSHYLNMDTGVNQPVQSTSLRGGVRHLNPYRSQWAQMCSSGVQDNQILPHYRNEVVKGQGSKNKLKCILCQREFKSLPALNGHMRSHGGIRSHPSTLKAVDGQMPLSREVAQTDPVVFPVSVPVKEYQIPSKLSNSLLSHKKQNDFGDSCPQLQFSLQKVLSSRAKTTAGVAESVVKQEKKRYRHCLVPLVISPYNASLEARGPVLFQSQLRSPSSCGDGAPYTPPPMLSPVRPGSGLFSSVNAGQLCESVPRVRLCKDNEGDDSNVTSAPEDKSSCMQPRINIGTNYQACIPDIQSRCKVEKDVDKAQLLWTPCHLDTPEKLQRVDDLLKMACSSALPGGGTNIEFTLHCLFECRDVIRTLEKLLSLEPQSLVNHTDYHYAGSDKWTLQEKRQFNKALITHGKDFHHVQKMVKTKSVAQCVEYYYTWKERLRLGRRFSTGPMTPGIQETEVKYGYLLRGLKSIGYMNTSFTPIKNHGGTRQPMRDIKNKTGNPQFLDNLSAASVCEVSSSGPIFNGDEWNHGNMGILSNSAVEHSRPRSAQHIAAGSVKSSPLNSTTGGETESNFMFPCTECGKVFLKVKSRNAHMKTHRQQDDSQFWQLHSLSEQETQPVTPASPSVIPLQLPIIHHTLPCNSGRDVQPLPINNTEALL